MNGATCSMAAGSRFRPVSLIVVLLASLALSACGVDDEDDPTAVPATVAVQAETPAALATAPPQASAAAASDTTASPAVAGTANPLANTVGRLAEGIAAVWPETSYRRVQVSTAAEDETATVAAALVSLTITDEVLYPGSVHRTIVDGNGATSAEFILVDERVFARGALVPSLFATGAAPDAWIEISGPLLAPGTAGFNILTQLRALLSPRYSDISAEQQAQEALLTAETDVDGRACFVFQTAETTQTGERLEVGIALEATGLLCSVTTTGGGLDTVETFTFDTPVTIAIPEAVAATGAGTPPAGTPGATPAATPAA